jgi:hypothetical protein
MDKEAFVCPMCDGKRANMAFPSPSYNPNASPSPGGKGSYPPCKLCKGRGFVVYDPYENISYIPMEEVD